MHEFFYFFYFFVCVANFKGIYSFNALLKMRIKNIVLFILP